MKDNIQIAVRGVDKFTEVKIKMGHVEWDSGLLDYQQKTELAKIFIAAAEELIPA
jgi:hypothetical protein